MIRSHDPVVSVKLSELTRLQNIELAAINLSAVCNDLCGAEANAQIRVTSRSDCATGLWKAAWAELALSFVGRPRTAAIKDFK